jgi:hypothetical protein
MNRPECLRLARVIVLALAVAVAVGVAAPSSARSAECVAVDVVIYSTDSIRLSQRLHANESPCASHYISATPMTDGSGSPRSGVAGPIRANGPRFHAMTEVRLAPWTNWVQTNGKTWFEAGVEFRRRMVTAGYDVGQGDTWAINEVGAPSGTVMGVDVLTNSGTARADFRDFLRGLYTGAPGMPPAPGTVFVANPTQITTDLAQHRERLQAWYGDAPFWEDMSRYVRFWAQETYADVRAWGVAGTTLDERAARLDEYFRHGRLLAEAGPGSTEAARAFLASAYVPLANASYPHTPPELKVNGIGFGFTNVPLPQMQSFIGAQTYALRMFSAPRIGFALSPPTNPSPGPVIIVAVEDGLTAAIHGSESDPLGACGPTIDGCDATIDGAQFNEAWKAFATWSPPTNTPEGSAVRVEPAPGVSVTFASVSSRGSTQAQSAPVVVPPPTSFQLQPGTLAHELTTTAAYDGTVAVCVAYDAAAFAGFAPRLFRLADGVWTHVTTDAGAGTACGSTTALGIFVVLAADPTPPTIVPHVDGRLGSGGWYVGDVVVTWEVADPQSAVTTSSCEPTTVDEDTAGRTLTCTATSDGGTSSTSVTVRRDATAPTLVTPAAVVVDATSGAGATATFAAGATDALDPDPAVVCSPTSGSLFAIGTTTVSCVATDDAGNSASASFPLHMKGTVEQLSDLADAVADGAGVSGGLRAALLAHLDAVLARFDPSSPADVRRACVLMRAFSTLVESGVRAGLVPRPLGDELVADATRIGTVLGC